MGALCSSTNGSGGEEIAPRYGSAWAPNDPVVHDGGGWRRGCNCGQRRALLGRGAGPRRNRRMGDDWLREARDVGERWRGR